jgi:hypothetical protein
MKKMNDTKGILENSFPFIPFMSSCWNSCLSPKEIPLIP